MVFVSMPASGGGCFPACTPHLNAVSGSAGHLPSKPGLPSPHPLLVLVGRLLGAPPPTRGQGGN